MDFLPNDHLLVKPWEYKNSCQQQAQSEYTRSYYEVKFFNFNQLGIKLRRLKRITLCISKQSWKLANVSAFIYDYGKKIIDALWSI